MIFLRTHFLAYLQHLILIALLKYFRKNDPYRIIALITVLVVTRIVFFLFQGSTSMNPEGYLLNSGPLADLLLQALGPDFPAAINTIVTAILILFNAVFLNTIFTRNTSFEESTYIPAALYVFLMSAAPDFYFLSPPLIGSPFVFMSLNTLFYHIKFRGTEENILSTGFTLGIACLFYYPFFWLYLLVLIIYLFYSGTITRRYFLMSWGFVLPIFITWLVYFLLDEGQVFINHFFVQIISVQMLGNGLEQALISLPLATMLGLIAVIQNFSGQGMTNHQILVQKCMSWVAIFGFAIFAIFGSDNLISLMLAIPAVSYFSTKVLISMKRKGFAEFLFMLILLSAIATGLSLY